MSSGRKRPDGRRAPVRMEDGSFVGFPTVLVVDEFGNDAVRPSVGKTPRQRETKFGYAISVTRDPGGFGAITADNRKTAKEIKSGRDRKNRGGIVRKIAAFPAKTRVYFVDKYRPHRGWENKGRRCDCLSESVDRALEETRGNVYVVVDNHEYYAPHCPVDEMMKKKSERDRTVRGDEYRSSGKECGDLLQTHDYVANAAEDALEHGDTERSRILGTLFFKLKGGRKW